MSIHHLQFSVPSNVLLFGEYFITQAGNTAVCMASDIRNILALRISTNTGNNNNTVLSLESSFNNSTYTWTNPLDCELYHHAHITYAYYRSAFSSIHTKTQKNKLDALLQHIRTHSTHIYAHINSNALYTPHNQKLGLGSSASSAILYCVLILLIHAINPFDNIPLLAQYASHTHYLWQNKKGSGYDVYTSLYGGMGIFTQHNNFDIPLSSQSSWHALAIPHHIAWYYMQGLASVLTPSAISSFEHWKSNNRKDYTTLHTLYTLYINNFISLCNNNTIHEHISSWFADIRNLGIQLGNAIGLDAHITIPSYIKELPIMWKATGAGNECAIGFSIHAHDLEHAKIPKDTIHHINIAKGLSHTIYE